jgi:Protein of unknown function (DUF3987)
MSLYEDWLLYTRDVQSPKPFIDSAFYFLIGAALQRRVWTGDLQFHATFANQFVAFIGPAAAGKSLITSPMKDLMDIPAEIPLAEEKELELRAEDIAKTHDSKRLPLIYLAPNSTTFEQFTQEVSRVNYIHRYVDEKGLRKIYAHSSAVFCLDELTSIFKHNAEQLSDFLLEAYNCGKYVRKLKGNGGSTDFCTNMCISLLGNTTLNKFSSMQNAKVVEDGFMSRTIVVYAVEKRFNLYEIPTLDKEQCQARERLKTYIRDLGKVFGQMSMDADAKAYVKEMFEENPRSLITNSHPALSEYYGRKNMHHKKVMFAMHFARCQDMTFTLQDAEAASKHLAVLEKDMHIPFTGLGRNETAQLSQQILTYVKSCPNGATRRNIFAKFYQALKSPDELRRITDDLITLDKVTLTGDLYKIKI